MKPKQIILIRTCAWKIRLFFSFLFYKTWKSFKLEPTRWERIVAYQQRPFHHAFSALHINRPNCNATHFVTQLLSIVILFYFVFIFYCIRNKVKTVKKKKKISKLNGNPHSRKSWVFTFQWKFLHTSLKKKKNHVINKPLLQPLPQKPHYYWFC